MNIDSLPELGEGEFYHHQIIGLTVITSEGDVIGKIEEVLETGSNDVYVVRKDNNEYLIPAIKEVVTHIDLEKGQVTIKVMNGLLDQDTRFSP
jgi:16S rRNA processing protein RimM